MEEKKECVLVIISLRLDIRIMYTVSVKVKTLRFASLHLFARGLVFFKRSAQIVSCIWFENCKI